MERIVLTKDDAQQLWVTHDIESYTYEDIEELDDYGFCQYKVMIIIRRKGDNKLFGTTVDWCRYNDPEFSDYVIFDPVKANSKLITFYEYEQEANK